ncbi:M1 family metallopeptidase [Chitinophagaceae bacterium LB-8]|uniref:M1 family metallopeptidase n=1 Tax=Paraflavisolibacter caeni TaxID=2982496 RepID=A0A9X2XW06_9BACT|nr:M1 family metallopeptidase [Paraflavisolibacter caeni]MCU7549657.1 M1 family metallopeptidase [Paraflavisolibacter caeni]
MNKLLLSILALCILLTAHSQTSAYWQQRVDYSIDVSLNDKEHTLDGFEKITYTNNSPDTLLYIWFHLWPNAYKNDKTAFTDQELKNGETSFYFSSNKDRGYINRLDFKVNGMAAQTVDHPQHIDIIKLVLPAPLLPQQTINITTPFHVKLPFNFSRSGHEKQSYQATQWYPKPAVYDTKGWHPMAYLDQGEFYSEFGKYDVRVTIPKNYVVAATGVLQNAEEKEWIKNRKLTGKNNESLEQNTKKKVPVTNVESQASKNKKQSPNTSHPSKHKKPNPHQNITGSQLPPETKTLHYVQDSIHDFAWFADKDFIVNNDTCKLSSGKVIEVYTYYIPGSEKLWKNSVQYCKDAVRFYSEEVGEYPYDVVSAVQGPPSSFAGGMEYPTITLISPMPSEKLLDNVLAHEIGHNWFYGMLASNERKSPWMDEGTNSFYEYKYMERKYGPQLHVEEFLLRTKAAQKTDQPIATPSEEFSHLNYALSAYHKTAVWFELIEEKLDKDKFKELMQQYFQQWRFRHPQEDDFKQHFSKALGNDTDSIFGLLHKTGILHPPLKGWRIATPFVPGTYKKYIKSPSQQLLTIAPAFGFNSYDKAMVGGIITNYKLPPSPFQFVAVPLYATGSKQFAGIGRMSYSIYSRKAIRHTEFFVSGSTFAMDKDENSEGKAFYEHFRKLAPGVQLTFKEKDPLSTVRKTIQWKTFFIGEDKFNYSTDTVINNSDTSLLKNISVSKESRYLNQLQLRYENMRELYPFDISLRIEQAKDFVRPTVTANYFFNYPKEGGMQLRFFAGKLFFTGSKTNSKTFANQRYHLQMTGPDGYEDYTYSNYFIGRNEFEGLASQQIAMRDGGFKVRTNLLANEVGVSDNWLMAVNLSSTVPSKFNPLSILKIPINLFADIGTYSEAWESDSEADRFLFDAGIHLPLLNGNVNVFIPLLYSDVYSDYIKTYLTEDRFLKKISFTIELNKLLINKLKREIDF